MASGRLEIKRDARRALDAIRSGGIAILPMDVGYSLIASRGEALERIFAAKQRAPTKYNAMLGSLETSRELHDLTAEQRDFVEAVTCDHDLPLGIIAPVCATHPLLRALDPLAARRSLYRGTVCTLLNAGPFHAEICALSLAECVPLFGSSANRSMQGTKFRVEDIEADIREIADVTIDYGLRKYHPYGASSTLIDMTTMTVVRRGSCFELIEDVALRYFGCALTEASLELEAARADAG